MPDWVCIGYETYVKRLSHDVSWRLIEVPMSRRAKGADLQKLGQKEGEQMLAAIPQGDKVVALTERGKCFDTQTLAMKLQAFQTVGENISFLIGGPEGLSAACLSKAHYQWSPCHYRHSILLCFVELFNWTTMVLAGAGSGGLCHFV
ncbi:MAG: rRNA ((1915)-N(3))-methyltransferase RlmH [Gammaproteobacteria bacterium]|nr:rRNA ((1915)-N(3))-methyltransferase RlmH [Gammaproteobacteria bacterium]